MANIYSVKSNPYIGSEVVCTIIKTNKNWRKFEVGQTIRGVLTNAFCKGGYVCIGELEVRCDDESTGTEQIPMSRNFIRLELASAGKITIW